MVAQDTIYTTTGVIKNVRIRDNKPTFIEYRANTDEIENVFLQKQIINAIKSKGGFHEIIIHTDTNAYYSVYYIVDSTGDTLRFDPTYDPSGITTIDTTVKLCRFKNDREYAAYYGNRQHLYINDPENKFLNCTEVVFEGVDFSCMKLVNAHELRKSKLIKDHYLAPVAQRVNSNDYYIPVTIPQKKVINDIQFSASSSNGLDSISWVTAQDYNLPAGKIPTVIKRMKFTRQNGIGLIFIVEKFVKQTHSIHGYWVAFDFETRQTLLLDYIHFNAVGSQSGGYGWTSYWLSALTESGVYDPISFLKYLAVAKKGKLELNCN